MPKIPRALKYLLQYAAVTALLALVLWMTRSQWQEFRNVENVRVSSLVWFSVCFVTSQFLAGVMLKVFTATFDVHLTFKEWFGLVCMRSLGNYLPLSAGLTANAAYLKMRKDLPITKFASLTAGNLVLTTLTGALLGVVLLLGRYFIVGSVHLGLLGIFSAITLCGLGAIFVPMRAIKGENRVFRLLRSAHEGWLLIRSRRGLVAIVVGLHLANLVLMALEYDFVLRDLGHNLDWPALMVLTVSTSIFRFASIFPGNLGLREAVAGGVVTILGFPFSIGLLASGVGRLVSMAWIFLLGTIFSFVLIHDSTP
jgi:uncharacterized membrane protein YbhN (UPF0104 family)